jgi:hypothetical protein
LCARAVRGSAVRRVDDQIAALPLLDLEYHLVPCAIVPFRPATCSMPFKATDVLRLPARNDGIAESSDIKQTRIELPSNKIVDPLFEDRCQF